MPRQLLRRLVSSRDGSVILETSIMIMILLMLMFGIIDVGRALYTENNLVSAAREGARYGATDLNMNTDTLAIKGVVIARFSPFFSGAALTNANIVTTPLPVGGPYKSIRVRINYPFTWITPIQRLVNATYTSTLHAQAEYNWENQ
jgi:Flp pilus assembly protein TadG